MPDQEFGVEVPEADRVEQLQEAARPDGDQDEPPAVDAGTADPADVFEQQLEVPVEDDEYR